MKDKDNAQIAFESYEHIFVTLKNSKARRSNEHHVGHPDRVEHDLSEIEKEHLALLRSNVHMEIANKFSTAFAESSASNDKLANKIFWLNVVAAVLTLVMAVSAIIELTQ